MVIWIRNTQIIHTSHCESVHSRWFNVHLIGQRKENPWKTCRLWESPSQQLVLRHCFLVSCMCSLVLIRQGIVCMVGWKNHAWAVTVISCILLQQTACSRSFNQSVTLKHYASMSFWCKALRFLVYICSVFVHHRMHAGKKNKLIRDVFTFAFYLLVCYILCLPHPACRFAIFSFWNGLG